MTANPDGLGDSVLDIVHRLRRVVVEVELFGSGFAAEHRIHVTDVRALIGLLDREREGQAATPGWLAGHLGIGSASTTALIDRLAAAGLVARSREDADRRKVTLAVTDHARDLGWSFFGPFIDSVLEVVDGWPEADLDVIRRFLDGVTGAVGRARQPGLPEISRRTT